MWQLSSEGGIGWSNGWPMASTFWRVRPQPCENNAAETRIQTPTFELGPPT
jgi:hypothetical protein